MTPFGDRLRALRQQKGATLATMAQALGVSVTYLSALERGQRSPPTPARLDQICAYFGIIWDDAEALKTLAQQSALHISIDTSGLDGAATGLAHDFAQKIRYLDAESKAAIAAILAPIPTRG